MPVSRRRDLAAIALAAVAVTIAACSGNGTSASSNGLIPTTVRNAHSPTPPPYTYTFQPVEHTLGSGSDARVTGINEKASTIVGLNGTSPDTYSSWTAHTPFPKTTGFREFRSKNYPGAAGTYMSGLKSDFYQAGTVFSPPPSAGLACTTCGIVFYSKGSGTNFGKGCGNSACEWTFMIDPNEGTGKCAATDVLGLAGANIVVGYYQQGSSSCQMQAFEGYYTTNGEYFADFIVPGADANSTQATGVNEEGAAVGTAQFNGRHEGWFYDDATYCTKIAAPNATETYPLSINWENNVVGYYVDSDQHSHGFLLINPGASPSHRIWETVDDPLAEGTTVVSDINTHHYITGWYNDEHGTLHGFVGTCTSDNCTTNGSHARKRGGGVQNDGDSGGGCVVSGGLKWRRR
jgi:hypothetical protein